MNSLKYFHINNVKFNYTLEFQSNHINDYWKHNAPLIEYCETLGINIPHYCYHKSLSISGNCRMCLVELKNSPKPIVSCAMSAKSCLNNSEVFTNSPLVKKARENILEFLLLNHPLDCPICDQGGECDLQDQSLFFGVSKKRFYNFKRVVTDKNIGPIVKTVMTRCIHCTRCVRFADEIAGTGELGMFGRGLESEIGTYVTKTFQSELSGNIIDLCPVGALTSKPYPFVSRSWELKNINTIDFSDGFGTKIQVYLKNNQIVKITPNYDPATNSNVWISDKTRFAFDGMFSPERVLNGFISTGTGEIFKSNSWKQLLDEIILTIYFQDHLNRHFLKTNSLVIIFDNNLSLEVLSMLTFFSKKYSFIKLRRAENQITNNDIENKFLTNKPHQLTSNLKKSNLCLLIGLNSRYENPNFNLKLRKRYLEGEFKVLSIGSARDLTFPTSNIGLNINTLKSIAEGNNLFCQDLKQTNTIAAVSSSLLQRKDSSGIFKVLEKIKDYSNINSLNVLNSSVNEAGTKLLGNYKSFSENDFLSSNGLYFLNSSSKTNNVKKITNIKLMQYFNNNDLLPKFCIEQNNSIINNFPNRLKNSYQIYNYINLPNNVFFETTGTYLNSEGEFNKTVKFVSTKKQTKEDWQILRKIFSSFKKISFTNNVKNNSIIHFNNSSLNKFKSFSGFMHMPTIGINLKANRYLNKSVSNVQIFTIETIKKSKTKIFSTNIKTWINDFYIGGKDSYSRYSSTMIKCSKIFRNEKQSFSHIS
jgi:NADH-quinone oxidoreductase chain G